MFVVRVVNANTIAVYFVAFETPGLNGYPGGPLT